MGLKFRTSSNVPYWKHVYFSLAFLTIICTGIGVFLSSRADNTYFQMIHAAASCHMSFAGLLISVILPYFVSIFLVSKGKPFVIYLVCGLRFLSVSACGYGIFQSFEYGGWLVSLLLQFSDYCLMPILIWYSIRNLLAKNNKRDIIICFFALVLIGFFYFCSISPFLVTLIDTYETMEGYAGHVGFDWRL